MRDLQWWLGFCPASAGVPTSGGHVMRDAAIGIALCGAYGLVLAMAHPQTNALKRTGRLENLFHIRVVGRFHKHAVDFGHQRAIGFRLVPDLYPVRIFAKSGPSLVFGFNAGKR